MLLVADSHIRVGTAAEQEFRSMLSWISSTDYDIAFLGDVLELWIGLNRFEKDALAAEFLEWCSREKLRRRVFFLEGNHEYFVVRHHRACFTDAAADELSLGGVVLAHGDEAQGIPAHHRFRWWSKSWLSHFLLRWLPFASLIVRRLKRNFERKSQLRVPHYPEAAVARWSAECFARHPEARRLILGHFHLRQEHSWADGRQTIVLPAWKDSGLVGLLDFSNFQVTIQSWRSLA